jgi:hypothetical protein
MAQPASEIKNNPLMTEARRLLENRVFQDIAERLDEQYYKQWADATQSDVRNALWYQASAIRDVLGQIKYMATERAVAADPEYPH